jgi:hypothetical protein
MKKNNFYACSGVALFLTFFLIVQCSKDNGSTDKIISGKWFTLFNDDFQRTDGAIGDNYSVQVECDGNGVAAILGNKLSFSGSGCWAIRYTGGIVGDTVKASLDCEVTRGNPNFGLTIKSRDLGNNWQQQEFYAVFVGNQGWGISRYQGQASNTLASKAYDVKANHVYKLQLMVMSKDIAAYIEDTADGSKDSIKVTDSDAMLTGTIVGINGYNSAASDSLIFDNFIIERFK